jgi:cold-inducible RNA-binding protein
MAKKLFVGSLPWATTSDDLKNLFSQAGAVSNATIVTDKMSGRSRGFGFVEFDSDADADNAVSMFNGKEYEGRALTVNEARPMADRPPRGGGGGGGYGHRDRY